MADEKAPAPAGQGESHQQDQRQQGAEPPKGKVKLAAGGDLDALAKQQKPRGMIGRIQGDARPRPGPLPMAHRRNVAAFTKPDVADRWLQDSAGIKAIEVGDNIITMFGIVGEDFWTGEGITAKKLASQLRGIGARDVEIHINSPGGDMFEGIAIFNTLREHPHKVTIKVMGMAASAASIISMAADDLQIGAASFLMIHNCSVFAGGNRHDHQEVADFLAPFDTAMAAVYAERTGIDAKEIAKMLDKETWLSGAQAVEMKFADGILSANDLKRDEPAREKAKAVHDLRATELQLCASGMSRSDARERINRIKGTPGAAPDTATPGAGDPPQDWTEAGLGLMNFFKQKG